MKLEQTLQTATQIKWGLTMSILTPKERLIRVLNKEKVERPPVICLSGMRSSVIVEVMNKRGNTLTQAHREAKPMVELAGSIYKEMGFENLGFPFSKEVEAEVLGSEIYSAVSRIAYKPMSAMGHNSRIADIIQAGYTVSRKYSDIPLIGNITGPISTTTSIIDPTVFLRELEEDKVRAHKVIDYVADHLIELAKLMIDNGAVVNL